jgi:hypothetical protein
LVNDHLADIDVGLSVTRVGSAAQWEGVKNVSGSYKIELAQYFELAAFSQFSSDLGADTVRALEGGCVLVSLLRQGCGAPLPLCTELLVLGLAGASIAAAAGSLLWTAGLVFCGVPQRPSLSLPPKARAEASVGASQDVQTASVAASVGASVGASQGLAAVAMVAAAVGMIRLLPEWVTVCCGTRMAVIGTGLAVEAPSAAGPLAPSRSAV